MGNPVCVKNVFDNDQAVGAGGGPSLNCCFILASSIDLSAGDPPPPDPDPRTAVIVDLPLYTTAFFPDPRLVGVRATFRFGGD